MPNGTLNRGDAQALSFNELTDRVIGAWIEIHRSLGPGLLESPYEECLRSELSPAGIKRVVNGFPASASPRLGGEIKFG